MSKRTTFRIPASTANLGAGFDALGLGLARYLRVAIEPADRLIIVSRGVSADRIPDNEENLIYKVALNTAKHRN